MYIKSTQLKINENYLKANNKINGAKGGKN